MAGIISGTATVASILISYQKAQRMAITLADSIKAIADSTTENAISLVGQSARRVSDILPQESVELMNSLTTYLERSLNIERSLRRPEMMVINAIESSV